MAQMLYEDFFFQKWYYRKFSGKRFFVIQKESLLLIFVHKRDSF
jgi:hypothetical protein